jgi:hypothetical protein
MIRRSALFVFALLAAINLAPPALASEANGPIADCFALDGSQNIMEEDHFGIADGKLTAGIPYRDAFAISGLWAPPFVSSDTTTGSWVPPYTGSGFKLGLTLFGKPVATQHYTWHPFHVDRAGAIEGVAVESRTMLIPGTRAGLLAVTLTNQQAEPRTIPLGLSVGGSLDRVAWWEFAAPKSTTPTVRKAADGRLTLQQGVQAIVLRASENVHWENGQTYIRGAVELPAAGQTKFYLALAIGPTAEATAACQKIAADPEKALAGAQAAYADQLQDLFRKLPRLKSNNASFDNFYYRSLIPLLMNRWDVPEFLLHPYYSTGSVKGGSVCSYLWDFGENWEIFPLFDAEANRAHIKQFLKIDMEHHFAFDPIGGKPWGPWYPVNQEKIVGLIYYHVKNTGDTAFLNETVSGKTILEHVIANALFGDDLTKPVALIDYGPSNSHLELRRGFPYNHVMPDLNGRRYESYLLAAQLADLAGKPAPQLRRRAEELKGVLKRGLWDPKARWFAFQDDKGHKDLRYTVQIFKLFNSKVLDAEEERGLLDHFNSEVEFLSEFGIHSLAKTDIAYDQVDIDNGGGGCYVSFPPQFAERLHKAGHSDSAENIWKRILWWGDRVPYWGDSLVANHLDYRKDTPLQCDIGSIAGAQAIIFGMFGVQAEFDGSLRIDPHPPKFAPRIELQGLRLRGHVLDITVDGGQYEVREGDRSIRAKVGQPVAVRGDQMGPVDAAGK